jgi:WD40 repeat protein
LCESHNGRLGRPRNALGGISAAGFIQGGGTVYSGHPDSTPAAGARTIFTIPSVISVGGQCTSSGGNSDVFVSNVATGNVFLWKVVAGQAASSLTLAAAATDFGPVTPVSQVSWQGMSPAGTFLIVASAFSDGTVCHFNAWGIQDP